jgi:amidohydrolase
LPLLLCWPARSAAQVPDERYFTQGAARQAAEARRVRRELHRIPELCYQEEQTAAYVADYLRALGLEVTTGLARHGVKAVLRGTQTAPVVGLRADMDALPITEQTGLPYVSRRPGRMHACGHDLHMTNVLIAARLLAEVRDQLPGQVVFLFQPCEEGPPAGRLTGAKEMIRAGALGRPRIEAMVGLHVLPELPAGVIGLREGPIMASSAQLTIEVLGQASHGAAPHEGVDAVYAASAMVMQLQSLVSRSADPRQPAVLSIGTIHGGTRFNVIADSVTMEGTVRTFSTELEDQIDVGIQRLLDGLATAYGIRHRYEFVRTNPFVNNDPDLTRSLRPVFARVVGANNVREIEPLTVAEDFAHYSRRIPSMYFMLGVGGPSGLHTPTFAPEEEALEVGPALLAAAAMAYLRR